MGLPVATTLELIITLVVVIVVLYYHARAQAGRVWELRPLAALNVIRAAIGRGAETGRAIHLSPGAGTIGERAGGAETIAGLLAAERVAASAALRGTGLVASSGDAVSYLALRGLLHQAYRRAGLSQDYNPLNVQLLAHQDPFAYAAGVAGIYERQRIEASQMLGSFGQELLLFGAEGQQRGTPQVIGATNPTAMALALLSTPTPLIGEEIYAVDAYLAPTREPAARLMAHDFLRTAVIVLVLGGLVYAAIHPFLGLPPLPRL